MWNSLPPYSYFVASILGATAVDFGGAFGFFFDSSSVVSFFFLFSTLKIYGNYKVCI